MIYKHLLAAIETHDEGEKMLVKARDLARGFGASLSLIHVVEYLPIDPAGDALLATPIDLCSERAGFAETRIGEWCDRNDLDRSFLRVVIGSITPEILRAQQETQADLIVVGSHGRTVLAFGNKQRIKQSTGHQRALSRPGGFAGMEHSLSAFHEVSKVHVRSRCLCPKGSGLMRASRRLPCYAPFVDGAIKGKDVSL